MDLNEAFANFQFEIGQVVEHKTDPHLKFVILSRYLEQCEGGFQKFYFCSSHAPVAMGLLRIVLSESELQSSKQVTRPVIDL